MKKICGTNNEHIVIIESLLGSPVYPLGNCLRYISNNIRSSEDFKGLCTILLDAHRRGIEINSDYINSVHVQLTGMNQDSTSIEHSFSNNSYSSHDISMISIPITETKVVPRTEGQKKVIRSLETNLLTFLIGPAGTGKTYLATAYALNQLLLKKKKRYIITRPVVEAGERLGFLPGDLEQKILPYLRPIYDVLHELAGKAIIRHFQEGAQLEIAPLAYMRGRTLKDAIVLLDEAQNCTPAQMKMFLTRLGEGSIAVVNGDLTQSDLTMKNGLQEAVDIFANTRQVEVVRLTNKDVQRSKLAKIVIEAYSNNKHGSKNNTDDNK